MANMTTITNPQLSDVRPGVIVGWRFLGMQQVRYYLVSRIDQPAAPENVDHNLWVYGQLVRKNGGQSTARDRQGGLIWLAAGEVVSVSVVDMDGLHAEGLAEHAERGSARGMLARMSAEGRQ